MIYLDNAATSWPKPEAVYRTMDTFLREKGANPGRSGHDMAVAAEKVIEETRVLLARLLNAVDEKDIVFTLNCTDALNLALKGFLKPGDHVITSSIGHNSLTRPLRKLEQQGVKVTRLLPCSEEGFVSAQDIEQAIGPKTRLIAVTHASNAIGVIQPIEEFGEVAKRHDLVLLVDAAQTVGALPIDVQAANIDLLAFPGHKALLGPTGTGGLYMSKRVELATLREGGTGTFSESEEHPSGRPQMYESGTPNTVGIAGLGAGVQYIMSRTLADIQMHKKTLVDRLLDGLASIPGVAVYGPRDRTRRVSVVSFNVQGWSPDEVGAVLDQAFDIKVRAGLHCAPAAHKVLGTYPHGTVRASVGCFNTLAEIDFLLNALGKIARREASRQGCL
ncbi:MAG: aminotransferase class V-fold PLP-dependent enzyme [Dehalococcoidia bacterium]